MCGARRRRDGVVAGQEGCHEIDLSMIEGLDDSDIMDRINAMCSCACKDAYKTMLFHCKWSWVEREGPVCEWELYVFLGERSPYGQCDNLNTNGTDRQLICPEREDLIYEGEQYTGAHSEQPCAKC